MFWHSNKCMEHMEGPFYKGRVPRSSGRAGSRTLRLPAARRTFPAVGQQSARDSSSLSTSSSEEGLTTTLRSGGLNADSDLLDSAGGTSLFPDSKSYGLVQSGQQTPLPAVNRHGVANLEQTLQDAGRRHGPDAAGAAQLQAFKRACVLTYRSLERAWRVLLDTEGSGRISFKFFHTAARKLGFFDAKQLWKAIDTNGSGFITLDEWAPDAYRGLLELREICYREYGGIEHAYYYGMDQSKGRTVSFDALQSFCKRHDFTGNVKAAYNVLDHKIDGFISPDEIMFLEACQGERFGKAKKHYLSSFHTTPRFGADAWSSRGSRSARGTERANKSRLKLEPVKQPMSARGPPLPPADTHGQLRNVQLSTGEVWDFPVQCS
mmetsp:Transcript_70762/g.125343  ORF Transcript_70762/g.125343 Transcript_70762/m.125343 type:complete len:378 (+) Transcript_70762:90-1223(+)